MTANNATFIEVRREAFDRNVKRLATARTSNLFAGVRRPFRGVEEKKDTYALMRVIRTDGTEIPLVDSSGVPAFLRGDESYKQRPYANFFIVQLTEARAEKSQIVDTFGEDWVYFFGEKPRSIAFNGYLLNTVDFDWKAEWWENYEKYLRGTALVENDARLYLFYDDVVMEGYLMNAQTVDAQDNRNAVVFSSMMLLTGYQRIRMVGLNQYPTEGIIQSDPKARISSYGRQLSSPSYSDAEGAANSGRSLPVRSSISDNYDEFVGSGNYWDNRLVSDSEAAQIVAAEDMEAQVAVMLKAVGFSDTDIGNVTTGGQGFTKTSPYSD